ncbi:uncharacterized protein PG986_000111 [Apiospora aurea]|uniref:Uncharacterized protein n=1 Tax=Apiospora aurea TaxID=335848 RepID=A0ABR1QTA2_9PEZI
MFTNETIVKPFLESFNNRVGNAMRTTMKDHLRTILQTKFGQDLEQGRYTLDLSRTPIQAQFDLLLDEITSKRELIRPATAEDEAVAEVVHLVFAQAVGPVLAKVLDWLQSPTAAMLVSGEDDDDDDDEFDARAITVGVQVQP